jgi:hypothetical protein
VYKELYRIVVTVSNRAAAIYMYFAYWSLIRTSTTYNRQCAGTEGGWKDATNLIEDAGSILD